MRDGVTLWGHRTRRLGGWQCTCLWRKCALNVPMCQARATCQEPALTQEASHSGGGRVLIATRKGAE